MKMPAARSLRILRCLLAAWFALLTFDVSANEIANERQKFVRILEQEMQGNQSWVRIHAAEALLDHGHSKSVEKLFAPEVDTAAPPYRIGVWRALASAAETEVQRQQFIARIREAMLDPTGTDRVHAAESLAKLGVSNPADRAALEQSFANRDDATKAFPFWLLALSSDEKTRGEDEKRLAELLESSDPIARLRAAFALSRVEKISPASIGQLQKQFEMEPADSMARIYFISALLRHTTNHVANLKSDLANYLATGKPGEQLEAALAFGQLGNTNDLALLAPLLNHDEADARIGAASGSLHILRRTTHRLVALDWGVIGLYLVCLMGMGVYYSRRAQTRDEYLLGGRNMKAWAVGLSYFATMFSTITYMSWPGEIIKNGPMMLFQILGFPIAIFLVGWLIIPFIMRLRVTSGYEILEARLGLSVRMLGSTFFLSMRLFWMAVILYATTRGVLIPVAGLDPSTAPYISALIGIVTVIYTSMGGFRAVVVTDVAQTVILFGGAVLAVVAISSDFGGLGWFPTQWDSSWQKPVFYDPKARISFVSAIVSLVVWHVCTAGSDQMAIQRYLSTRDVKTARRMFTTALTSNAIVFIFLAALGLALFAYFRNRPEMMNVGQNFALNADKLFPQFIVFGLPAGISGLVVAGLLAAAMSSLSSGVSSSSSVITVDFIERFRRQPAPDTNDARTARIVSWLIGIVVVALSSVIGVVQGNLLEITFKVVNLLTAPLFGLFFMAMFVRFATPFGTICGAVAGITTAVLVNYWKEFTGATGISFLWAMPLSLSVQIAVGCVASLIPVGPAARPMIATDALLAPESIETTK